MTDFTRVNLAGSRFEDVDLGGAEFRNVSLRDARLRGVDLSGAVVRGAEVQDMQLDGEIVSLRVNGVDVAPLVEAELDRRYPERAAMRPADAHGFREAWDILDRLWRSTVDRARGLDPAWWHERVDGEWSFVENLRHLVFATDSWVTRAILGDPSPWHPLGLPHDEMPDIPGVPRDRDARPSLDEVLAVRADRMATVRKVFADLTDADLDQMTEPVSEPGWPPPQGFLVRECLRIVLSEEWQHRRYVERYFDTLEQRG